MELLPYKRIGVIDLGTNSVRFDIHQINPGGFTTLLHREKLMVRLGENLFIGRKLDAKAISRTLEAFSSFSHTASLLKVSEMVAFATSAVREAKDGPDLVKAIRSTTGIDLKIIAGLEEARLIASGILAHKGDLKGTQALVDIGGGSTEITIVTRGKITHSHSFPLGVARIQQVFLKSAPPTPERVQAAEQHIREILKDVIHKQGWPKVDRILGSSGTIRALHRIAKKNVGKLSRDRLREMTKAIVKMTPTELSEVPGMEPKRVDLIAAGAILFEQIAYYLRARKVAVTNYSLRDGILQQVIHQQLQARWDSQKFDLQPLYEKAIQFGEERGHVKRLVETAEALFDRLKPLHELPRSWKPYLSMAVLLRRTGKAISPLHFEQHSYYIARHTELPVVAPWEKELVALLCLYQDEEKIPLGDFTLFDGKKKVHVPGFQKLLAILRIVDGLAPSYRYGTIEKKIRIYPDKVILRLTRGKQKELALLRLQQKKSLFEKVFSRDLILESD